MLLQILCQYYFIWEGMLGAEDDVLDINGRIAQKISSPGPSSLFYTRFNLLY